MRVLHFYKTYYPDTIGGVEQVINQLVRATQALGVQSDVLTLSSKSTDPTIELDGHLVHRAPMLFEIASTGFSISAFWRFAELVRQADLIHYHYPWPFMDLVHAVIRPHKPTIVTYHSDIIRQETLLKLYKPLQISFLSSVDQIIATSPNYYQTSKTLSHYQKKLTVIPIGLDKSSYPIPSNKLLDLWRNRFGGRFFLFIGVLRYYKGLFILLEALQKRPYPVVIVGSGPIEEELKQSAAALALKNIHFLGLLSNEDKIALLMLSYAIVFPSHLRSEAFGISLLEGAMYGKPMISSEIGTGTSYINIHNETGLVVPPGDADSLSDAMHYLWENPLIAKKMGKQAEQRYWERFTAEQMAVDYVEIYKKIINNFAVHNK